MSDINPVTIDQILLKKISRNMGNEHDDVDISEINPLTIDQIFLKEIAISTEGGGGGSSSAYSTTEHEVGIYLDGTTKVYEKSYYVASPTKGANAIIQDADMAAVDQLVSIVGTFRRELAGYVLLEPLDTYDVSHFAFCRVIKESSTPSEVGVVYYLSTSDTVKDLFITIRYTKEVLP